ncbi:TIGR01459 family HAD-type hydrolase [Aestuariivirga sp.]|uniref:TIGR01459 family HAD-type hydrolase n=1 Tax=Aestuariivirga sp. TaxID=2650926 RepID=UPI0039E4F5C9
MTMEALSRRYPVWFCDIWGVVHNGRQPFLSTTHALAKHRSRGGTVILVTNSPRTRAGVARQLAQLGVDPQSHDSITTSGDVTRDLVVTHGGGKIFHLGPERDLSIFEGLNVERVSMRKAHACLCTGLFDDRTETPKDYADLLAGMKSRDLEMICANPDKIVRHGDRILYCAGALAEAYANIDGRVQMAGKPYRPIYDLALAEARRIRGGEVKREDILAIGDGPETDIRGAAAYGLDALLVAEGVTDASEGLEAAEARVRSLVPEARIAATMHQLRWD